ncbi:hypothetical protein RPHASCH2410_PD04455 (plasmid) [Rhizobium phaseoli Ch24-10]|nr:hypothetical protein RPHASCH2410_PD04455 [Rhizobium phaseoli Ch24-10]
MERREIEALREQVSCIAVLEHAGFAIDAKESTRRAVKFRRGGEIIIVTYQGRGLVRSSVRCERRCLPARRASRSGRFLEGADRVAALVGFQITEPEWQPAKDGARCDLSLPERWQSRRRPWPGSSSWRYLNGERRLPATVLRTAINGDLLREGPQGSMWAAHRNFPLMIAVGRKRRIQ